ncbi:MAG TPA: lysylphosphatidylglycerol synthase domain-containing protein, partial [Solirubrobacter sp.]
MRRLASAAGVVLALALLAWLCHARGGEVQRALALVPTGTLVVLTALHLVTLALRSEAWRLTLAAVDDHVPPRRAVHAANAGAFVAGALESHSALPVRAVLLRRLAGPDAPRADQILLSDAPIFLLEVCATAVVLCAATPYAVLLLAAAALALTAGSHSATRRVPTLRGLGVLRDRRRLAALIGWVGAITSLAVAR